jgi:PAS domain S-box-containing protein
MHDRMISGEERVEYADRAAACGDAELCALAQALPSMIGYWDRNLVNRFANRAYEQWFGVEAEEIAGVRMQDAFGGALFELNRPYLDHVMGGETVAFEWDLPAQHGRAPQRVLASYLPDLAGGKVQGFFVLAHDITALSRARHAPSESGSTLRQAAAG